MSAFIFIQLSPPFVREGRNNNGQICAIRPQCANFIWWWDCNLSLTAMFPLAPFKTYSYPCISLKIQTNEPTIYSWYQMQHVIPVSWLRHPMETFSPLLALCAGNSPITSEFPTQRPVTRSFDGFFFICAWINGWANNREAGDLRRDHAHYDVIVMMNGDMYVFINEKYTG